MPPSEPSGPSGPGTSVEDAIAPGRSPTSLATAAARQLATTTKTVPQMRAITSRWLLKVLSWVDVAGGVYRVNRRLVLDGGDGRVRFAADGAQVRVVPEGLRELGPLREIADEPTLQALADRFQQRRLQAGDVIAERHQRADQIVLIVHGKAEMIGAGKFGEPVVLDILTEGDHIAYWALGQQHASWPYTLRATTATTVMTLSQAELEALVEVSPQIRAHLDRYFHGPRPAQNRLGEAAIATLSGHVGEPSLPRAFVDYDVAPREYELSVSQAVLRTHTRVAELYSEPMDQFEQQLRLTVEALREEQEHELVNNRSFGLLHNASPKQRISARTGPPTPDDMDDLLARRRKTHYYLAHARAIAAFSRECSRRGLSPEHAEVMGRRAPAWRGVPILSCNKIPISRSGATCILAVRLGEEDEGVIGLRRNGLPDEYEPGLNVRRMSVDEKAVTSYLVSAYYSIAVLVPDALGVLENVEIGR